jgi:hypothetical protein
MKSVTQFAVQTATMLLLGIITSVTFGVAAIANASSYSLPSSLSLQAQPTPAEQKKKPASLYSDCSVLSLRDVDTQPLTKEEVLAQKYTILLEALDDNSQCMEDAAIAGQQAQIASGGGAKGTAGLNTGQNNGQTTGQGNTASVNRPASASNPASPQTQGNGAANQVVTGKSAGPCALYQELLGQATSPEEREFYEAELKKYACL